MFRQAYDLLRSRVPDFRNPWKGLFVLGVSLAAFGVCMGLFLLFDSLFPYGALVSQASVALAGAALAYRYYRRPERYQGEDERESYRLILYRHVIPILVTWYVCCFHPLLIAGPRLLPRWLALILGALLLAIVPLTRLHLNRASPSAAGGGMDLFGSFGQQGTPARGGIYAYIRYPLHFALVCCSLGCGFLRNNLAALLASLLTFAPPFVAARLEDQELVRRYGELQRRYLDQTGALLPWRDPLGFLRHLFLFR